MNHSSFVPTMVVDECHVGFRELWRIGRSISCWSFCRVDRRWVISRETVQGEKGRKKKTDTKSTTWSSRIQTGAECSSVIRSSVSGQIAARLASKQGMLQAAGTPYCVRMIGLPGLTDGELAKRGRFYAKSNRLLSEAFLLLVMLFTVQDAFLLTTLISLANKRDQVPEFASQKNCNPLLFLAYYQLHCPLSCSWVHFTRVQCVGGYVLLLVAPGSWASPSDGSTDSFSTFSHLLLSV